MKHIAHMAHFEKLSFCREVTFKVVITIKNWWKQKSNINNWGFKVQIDQIKLPFFDWGLKNMILSLVVSAP